VLTIVAAQMLRFLTKLPKYRSFDYQPIYYNEDKEDLNRRIEAAERGNSGADFSPGQLRKSWSNKKTRVKRGGRSNALLFGLIIGLSVVAYYLLF